MVVNLDSHFHSPSRTCRERTISFRKAHKNKKSIDEPFEAIFVYDLSTGSLQKRGLSKVYGQTNLYRDEKNAGDVDHIENKLSYLEQKASGVIRSIHNGLRSQRVPLSRVELATLRKFIFLMHYRNDAVSSTYYRESNPQNAPLAEWIRRYKETRRLETDEDVWLDGLNYYLDTPHQDIVAAGERIRERYGNHRLHEMLRNGVDPDLEEWYAIDYECQANYFFLGVWEAAKGQEFVLGSNGFGLWEGLIYGSPGAHRLYVVSPRVAIVLRRTFLHHPHANDPSVLSSTLANIAITKPNIHYADQHLFDHADEVEPWEFENKLNTYRSSKLAQQDQFTFKVTKLTPAETYAVNEVVMMNANLHPSGSITFATPNIMLETLQKYIASHITFLGGKRQLFAPLLCELSTMKNDEVGIGPSPPPANMTWAADTDADLQLHMFLRFTLAKNIQFPSIYNRAYVIFHMATEASSLSNSVSSQIRRMVDAGISELRYLLDPPLPMVESPRNWSHSRLVESLSQSESEIFFALVGYQVDQTGVGSHSNDGLANMIYEAATIGIAQWLLESRPDVLAELVSPWIVICN